MGTGDHEKFPADFSTQGTVRFGRKPKGGASKRLDPTTGVWYYQVVDGVLLRRYEGTRDQKNQAWSKVAGIHDNIVCEVQGDAPLTTKDLTRSRGRTANQLICPRPRTP